MQTEAGVREPDATALWIEWVVSRSLCVFRPVDVSAVGGGELEAVLNLRVREWAPFDDAEFKYRVYGNRALVWAWDGALRRQSCRALGVKPDVVLPESMISVVPAVEHDPLLLVDGLEGVEARFYQGEQLLHSRWWPEAPDLRNWNQLRALFDLPPVDRVPEPRAGALPEGRAVPLQSMLLPFLKSESTVFALTLSLFLVFGAYHLSALMYANIELQRSAARVAELSAAVTPVLEARDEALLTRNAIDSIAYLHTGPLQLQYLSDLLVRLEDARAAGRDVELMAWDFKSSGVAISVSAEALSAAELLSVFEAVPWLHQPKVGDDRVSGRMRVTGEIVDDWRFESAPERPAQETAAQDMVADT